MRILALETSTTRGSVALAEGDRIVAYGRHDDPNRHAERLLGLVEEALFEAAWDRRTVERVAAGVGPGSFTGVRVGLAVAAGLSIGLGIPAVGVGSLAAVARGYDVADDRIRVVLKDARRQEFFFAAYAPDGTEVVSPQAIPQAGADRRIVESMAGREFVLVGPSVGSLEAVESSELTADPDARMVALLARQLDPATSPATPQYVRGANAIVPHLPPSPLDQPRMPEEEG